MNTISLCMIVRNESHVIERCLDSVKKLIDYVIIIDTGSNDNTIDLINNWLANNNVKGEVISEEWKSFSYNRSYALKMANEKEFIDYVFMIDADEVLVYDSNFNVSEFKDSLLSDIYSIKTNMNGLVYYRPTLTTNKKPMRYEGVVHEFLAMDGEYTKGIADGFYNKPIQDSNRNINGNKFLQDIKLLEDELSNESIGDWLKSRYTFYLAQSYRDSGNYNKAIEYYDIRSKQGFWEEEVYISIYNIGNLANRLNYDKSFIIQKWMDAYELLPKRAESLWAIMQYCRLNKLYNQGYLIGKTALNIECPSDSLFVEKWIYDYGIIDEMSILSYWVGKYEESKFLCNKLLEENKIPNHYIERIKYNLSLI